MRILALSAAKHIEARIVFTKTLNVNPDFCNIEMHTTDVTVSKITAE